MTTAAATFHPAPSRPTLALPKGATDTHCHVFGPVARFPFAETATFTAGDAPKEVLFALHDQLGVERSVVVQSSCHGYDNRVTADAIAARHGRCLGVALLPVDVSDAELGRLDRQGFRGVRFNYMAHLGASVPAPELLRFSRRLADIGWHLQIHMDNSLIAEMASTLAAAPVPVVIDHMGRINAAEGLDQEPFAALLRLMERPHLWVKVSGAERASRQEPPYEDALPFARLLVETYPDRVLWGTDWPHPNLRAAPPDDGLLVDLLNEIASSEGLRHALLVDNPFRLYRFSA